MSTMQGDLAILPLIPCKFAWRQGLLHLPQRKEGVVLKLVLSVVLKRQADNLVRLTGLCYRRGVAIESLSYSTASQTGEVQFRAVLACGRLTADQLHRQISNLIGVVGAEIAPYSDGGM